MAIVLGVVQGVAEFLPISSSGHLSLLQYFFGMTEPDALYNILLHFATLIAVCVVYWRDILDMIMEFFRGIAALISHDAPRGNPPEGRQLVLLIILATLPLFLILPIKDAVEGLYANTFFVGGALLVTGLLLYFCDRLRKGRKNERSASIVDVLIVGLGQAVATCPGISRSGMTISMGCFRGFERRFAVRFAFLLSIPAVLGANILQLKDVAETGVDLALLPAYLVGVAAAALSGYLSIRLVRMVADKGKFGAFAYYCWIAGVVTVVLSLLKALNLLPWLAA